MKKLLRNICLLLLPIVLYYCVFLVFEPQNYFGLRSKTYTGTVFGALRSYERNPVNSIIIGDSRMAHFDMDTVEQIAGRPFGNLAFGGATLAEQLGLLDWWLEKYPQIDEVVFELSFYTLNANYNTNRTEAIQAGLSNPFLYLTNLNFNLEALQNVVFALQGQPLGGGEAETEDPATYTYTRYTTPAGQTVEMRTRLAEYLAYIAPTAEKWQPWESEFEALLKAVNKYTARGIRFTVVLPPVHPTVAEYIIKANGIDGPMREMLGRLGETGALVLDYEIENPPVFADDQYFDGFHLDYERGLPAWAEMLFADINAGKINSGG
ncbi:MAG: hypothetical protein ACK5L3_11625 [Oscillospiraceae bacterium]